VLPAHPRRADVTARVVELDPRNAAAARAAARRSGLDGVEIVVGERHQAHLRGFANTWLSQPAVVLATPFGRVSFGDASAGLFGGMVFAALDYWHAGIAPPATQSPSLPFEGVQVGGA
jgi:hypothetical protein